MIFINGDKDRPLKPNCPGPWITEGSLVQHAKNLGHLSLSRMDAKLMFE